jgi:hypothetical protein
MSLPLSATNAQTSPTTVSQVTVKIAPGQLDISNVVFRPWRKYFSNPSYVFVGSTKDTPQGSVNLTLTVTIANGRPPRPVPAATPAATSTPTPATSSFNVMVTFKPSLKFNVLTWSITNVVFNGQQPTAQQERTIRNLARYALLPAWTRAVRNAYYGTLRGTRLTNIEITPQLLTITGQVRIRTPKTVATPAATQSASTGK